MCQPAIIFHVVSYFHVTITLSSILSILSRSQYSLSYSSHSLQNCFLSHIPFGLGFYISVSFLPFLNIFLSELPALFLFSHLRFFLSEKSSRNCHEPKTVIGKTSSEHKRMTVTHGPRVTFSNNLRFRSPLSFSESISYGFKSLISLLDVFVESFV